MPRFPHFDLIFTLAFAFTVTLTGTPTQPQPQLGEGEGGESGANVNPYAFESRFTTNSAAEDGSYLADSGNERSDDPAVKYHLTDANESKDKKKFNEIDTSGGYGGSSEAAARAIEAEQLPG
jgi:hypothetical protein